MSDSQKGISVGCLLVGIFLLISVAGLIVPMFNKPQKSIKAQRSYLTLTGEAGVDTLLSINSSYSIRRDNALKEQVKAGFTYLRNFEVFSISIPSGLTNNILIGQFENDADFDLNKSAESSVDNLKNNPEVTNLYYNTTDTIIQNLQAKITNGSFNASNKSAVFKNIVFVSSDYLYVMILINKEADKKLWLDINKMLSEIKLHK